MVKDFVFVGGREYVLGTRITVKYKLDYGDLEKARKNGLPFITIGKKRYYNEKDIHDYYSGRIGNI